MKILIVIPIRRTLNWKLQTTAIALAHRAIAEDNSHEFGLWLDFRDTLALKHESTPWSRLCRVGEKCLSAVDLSQWDRVLWTDADVVEYPGNICTRLLSVNPNGITAPLPLVQNSTRLYDTAASIQKGAGVIDPKKPGNIMGRNLRHDPPYWHDAHGNPLPQSERFVSMDCVGMTALVPANLMAKAGARDHPAFTGWWEVCRLARESGLLVGIDTLTVAYHADLPQYSGEGWH